MQVEFNDSCDWQVTQRSTTLSTENTTPPKSARSRNSEFSMSRDTESNVDFDLIWICPEEFEFLVSVDFGVITLSEESVTESRL